MKAFVLFLFIAILTAGYVKSKELENEKFEDDSKDNSIFDKILSINQQAARSRSGPSQPKLIQGDIVETNLVKQMMAGGLSRGAASTNERHRWPDVNGKRIIPYVIDNDISSYGYRKTIEGAMIEWMSKVPCLRFVRRTNQLGYLHFQSGSGCSSAVGYQGSRQFVSLSKQWCMHHGIVVHEIGHALGFWHEQSRVDRDRYVRIIYKNIQPHMIHNFQKMRGTSEDVGYDYNSIMHYGPKAFSKDGSDTIVAYKKGAKIGQRQGLSESDVQEAMNMYCRS